tara:strand:- start:76204 stop:76611 length:408 start_codon:yes stop_codon:yes gene_type:complete
MTDKPEDDDDEYQNLDEFLKDFYGRKSEQELEELLAKITEGEEMDEDDDLDIIVHGPLHVPMIDLTEEIGMAFVHSGSSVGIVMKDSFAREKFINAITTWALESDLKKHFIISPKGEDEDHIKCIEHIITDHFDQ